MKKSVLKTLISVTAFTFVAPFTIFETSALGDMSAGNHIDFTWQGRNMCNFDPIDQTDISFYDNYTAMHFLSYLYKNVPNIPTIPAPEDRRGRWDVRADRYLFEYNMYGNGTPMIEQIPKCVKIKFFKMINFWNTLFGYNKDLSQEFLATQLALLNQHGGHCNERISSIIIQAYDNTREFVSRMFFDGSETTLTGTLKKELQQKLRELATTFVNQNTTDEAPFDASLRVNRHEPLYFVNAVVSDFNKVYLPQEEGEHAPRHALGWDGNPEIRNQLIKQILKPSTIIKTLDEIKKDRDESCVGSLRQISTDIETLTDGIIDLPFDTFCKLIDEQPDIFKEKFKGFIEKTHKEAADTSNELYDKELADRYTELLYWVKEKTNDINLTNLINDAVIIYGFEDDNISTSSILKYPGGVKALIYLYLTCELEPTQ